MEISRLPILEAAGVAATLVAEHVTLYARPRRLSRPQAYALGTATIGAWFSAWCLREGQYEALTAFWTIATAGGAAVAACYTTREAVAELGLLELSREARNGHRSGA